MPVPPTTSSAGRALAFQAATIAACADAVRATPFGRVVETPALEHVYSLNAAEVSVPGADVDAVIAAAPATPRPSVFVTAEEDIARFGAALDGWEADNEVTMILGDAPDPPPPGVVREGSSDETFALLRDWIVADFGEQGPEAVEQLLGYLRRQAQARPTRRFVSEDGRAMTVLWQEGGVAQVEDVYTSPEARGRGYARALVSHVAALARAEGNEVVFLVADADDTPRELYRRLGFADAARASRFTRRAQGS